MKAIIFDLQGTLIGKTKNVFPEVYFCLSKLSTYFPLALVSEGKEILNMDDLLVELKIKDYFRIVLHCKGTSLQKKDGSAFRHICNKLKIASPEMIVVGDNLDTDIAGAKKIGAISIRIRRGKYFSCEPTNSAQEPDYEIYSLIELLDMK